MLYEKMCNKLEKHELEFDRNRKYLNSDDEKKMKDKKYIYN